MLKTFIFAAGTLLVATLGASERASAAPRTFYGHRYVAAHGFYPRRAQFTPRRYAVGARAYTQRTRFGHGFRTVRAFGPARNPAFARTGRTVFARPAYGARRLAYRNARFAAARRDTMIRNYVGPRSAYTPVSSGTQVGSASYYGGRSRTASGGFVGAATCAHRSLPFGTRVLVTNLANARQAILTVNDRGPFVAGRIVDVSTGAAGMLGMLHSGTAPVRVQVVGGSS